MRLTKEEKAARRAAFQALTPGKKAEHIYLYYKWYILLGLIALMILGSAVQRALTQKEPVVYLALCNVAVGEDLEAALTQGYLAEAGLDARRQEVYLYPDLYLSEEASVDNNAYAYASRIKLMGAVNTKRMDLVLMNREAYDILSSAGYLLPLTGRTDAPLTENTVILSDNSIDYTLGEAEEHVVETGSEANAVELTGYAFFEKAGFPEQVYAGVIANSPRVGAALDYLEFLMSGHSFTSTAGTPRP